jgi:hypothetical protein
MFGGRKAKNNTVSDADNVISGTDRAGDPPSRRSSSGPRLWARWGRLVSLLGFGLVVTGGGDRLGAGEIEMGPLAHHFKLTLEDGERIEAVGPIFSHERSTGHEQWAFTPFLTYRRDRLIDSEEMDILYPFITYDRSGEEYKWRFFLMTTISGGRRQEEQSRRFTLFPIVFSQWTREGPLEYFAVFPLGGTIRDRLNRDEMRFWLFPLYAQTRKRDMVTENYLYPIFHVRRGEGLRGWQFWPLMGHETKVPGVSTNGWGDVELVPGHRKDFVLWPLHFRHDLGLGTTNETRYRIWLPVYAEQRSPARDSTTWLWPFFTYTDDRAQQFREWDMPWPLVVFARGEGKTVNRVWPLYSRARSRTLESNFYLWPIYKYNRSHSAVHDRERTRWLFFLYSQTSLTYLETGEKERRWDFWPFYSRWQEADGRERLQVFSILEPLLPRNEAIERNYSSVWSVWRTEKDPARGRSSRSLFWNIYRRDVMPGARSWSAMFGLVRYEAGDEGRKLRILHVPVMNQKQKAARGSD